MLRDLDLHPPLSVHPRVGRWRPFERVSLSQQFLLAGALVLLLGVGATGTWLGRQIEAHAVNRAAQSATVYVESVLAPHLIELVLTGRLSDDTRRVLDGIFVGSPLAGTVVRFKLWTADGRVHYSSAPGEAPQSYALHDHQAYAFAGQMQASVSELDGPDNATERTRWNRLIEVYVPLRARGASTVAAVAEFYHAMDGVEADIHSAQRQSWLAVSLGALLLFSLLYALVNRASVTITGQRCDLRSQLADLQRLLAENRAMNQRLQQAGAQTTSMTELSLRRIAADLHDGPAQDLALALLTLDEQGSLGGTAVAPPSPQDLTRLRTTLSRSMTMLRDIAGGLVVPGMAQLTLAAVIRRAATDGAYRGGVTIEADVDERLDGTTPETPEAVKITAYRVVQEALSNSLKHAHGHPPRVAAQRHSDRVVIVVSDDGPGFDAASPVAAGHLGLGFLRERVQLLGGTIHLRSSPGQGTTLTATLPLQPTTEPDAQNPDGPAR